APRRRGVNCSPACCYSNGPRPVGCSRRIRENGAMAPCIAGHDVLLIIRTASSHSGMGDCVQSIISVRNLVKTYASGFQALKGVDLEIRRGEIFALLGPNGAGKTTLISIISGIVNPTSGTVIADGHDIRKEYRETRSKIGLVLQELASDVFGSVWATVNFSHGLFGKPPVPAYLEKVLKYLSLLDKNDTSILSL